MGINRPEAEAKAELKRRGWEVTRKGFPDYICYHRDGSLAFVEVKPDGRAPLKWSQHKLFFVLARYGIPVFRWDPDEGLVLFQSGTEFKRRWQNETERVYHRRRASSS